MKSNTIIFIPGFKGSTLIDQDKSIIWPNFIKAQINHKISLSNDIPEFGINNPMHFESGDIVNSVALLPGLLKYRVYEQFITVLQKQISQNTDLILFHYDWRQDLMLTIEKLIILIEQIARDKQSQIDIICHSLGGLITSYLMNSSIAETIRQVFFVAVPFQGTLKALLDLMYGTKLGLNKTLLSKESMASFPSIYYLLPRYAAATPNHSFYDINTWKKFNLCSLASRDNHLKFVETQLNKANSFYNKLENTSHEFCKKTKYIFINNLTHSTPTSIEFGLENKILSSKGDGSVIYSSLQIPDYFKKFNHEIYHIDKPHAQSFRDSQLIKIILDKLRKNH